MQKRISSILNRFKHLQAQKAITWDKEKYWEIPEAESVGILPYFEWLELLRAYENDSLTAEQTQEFESQFIQVDHEH